MAGIDQPANGLDELPEPDTPEVRAQGCTCLHPEPGQGSAENPRRVNMECHVHGMLWLFKEGKGEMS